MQKLPLEFKLWFSLTTSWSNSGFGPSAKPTSQDRPQVGLVAMVQVSAALDHNGPVGALHGATILVLKELQVVAPSRQSPDINIRVEGGVPRSRRPEVLREAG